MTLGLIKVLTKPLRGIIRKSNEKGIAFYQQFEGSSWIILTTSQAKSTVSTQRIFILLCKWMLNFLLIKKKLI